MAFHALRETVPFSSKLPRVAVPANATRRTAASERNCSRLVWGRRRDVRYRGMDVANTRARRGAQVRQPPFGVRSKPRKMLSIFVKAPKSETTNYAPWWRHREVMSATWHKRLTSKSVVKISCGRSNKKMTFNVGSPRFPLLHSFTSVARRKPNSRSKKREEAARSSLRPSPRSPAA